MNIDVLTAQFEAHKQECASDKLSMDAAITIMRTALDNKVSFKHFYWIVGILVGIQTGLVAGAFWYMSSQLGDLGSQIRDVGKVTTQSQEDISFLKGKLSPYDVQYSK